MGSPFAREPFDRNGLSNPDRAFSDAAAPFPPPNELEASRDVLGPDIRISWDQRVDVSAGTGSFIE